MRRKHSPLTYLFCMIGTAAILYSMVKLWKLLCRNLRKNK